jgi:hypothetical protein
VEPVTVIRFVMSHRMLCGIGDRAEQLARGRAEPISRIE